MALSTCEQLVLWFYGLVAGLQSQPNDAAGAAGSSKKSDLAKGQLVGTFMKIRAGKLACFFATCILPAPWAKRNWAACRGRFGIAASGIVVGRRPSIAAFDIAAGCRSSLAMGL